MSMNKSIAEGVLFTDFYQLTMAQLYFKAGLHERQAQFDYFYRKNPDYGGHQAGFCITAGLQWLIDWMQSARFDDGALESLRNHTGRGGERLFSDDFLAYLARRGSFEHIAMHAIAEGRVVHPNEPIVVARGPLSMAQMLESALLNHCNYQTLIASKAARIKQAGKGRLVIEFGMRRAHFTAANAGARAALIGGADFTSNTGVSYELGFPPKGTHAHSMVQVFMALGMGEIGAFREYAKVYPNECILLVDTIDTLKSGVPNAITVFKELRDRGHTPAGIRLDSGDLAHLAVRSAAMLNAEGFEEVPIVLSNKLDEIVLTQIIEQIRQECPRYHLDADQVIARLVYGVGTRLITSRGYGALDGVYKLAAVRNKEGWVPAFKISETPEKTLNPGDKRVWRIYDREGVALFDLVSLYDEDPRTMHTIAVHDQIQHDKKKTWVAQQLGAIEPLLEECVRDGRPCSEHPSMDQMRGRRDKDIMRLDTGVRRLINPRSYEVCLTERLWRLKQELVASAG